MIETHFELLILKEDLKKVHEIIKKYDFNFPAFFIDLDETIKIEFVSDYEEFEFLKEIGALFDGFEFKEKLSPGENNIKLTAHRFQSPYSTDGWGRPLENPLNEVFFLVKKRSDRIHRPKLNPEIIVSFKQEIKSYYINLVSDESGGEKVFLVLNEFENDLYGINHEAKPLDRFSRRLMDSYSFGLSILKQYVDEKIKASKKGRKRKSKS